MAGDTEQRKVLEMIECGRLNVVEGWLLLNALIDTSEAIEWEETELCDATYADTLFPMNIL